MQKGYVKDSLPSQSLGLVLNLDNTKKSSQLTKKTQNTS